MKKQNEELIIRYLSGMASVDEIDEVETWIKETPDNQKTFNILENIYYTQQMQYRILSHDSESSFESVMQRSKVKKRRLTFYRVSVVASVFLLVISFGLFFDRSTRIIEPTIVEVTAPNNAQTKLFLPDGTEVYLNKGSSICYPSFFSHNERNVTLNGEAFFKVYHNPEQPFILSNKSKQYTIKVLGTEFNIQAYEDEDFVQTTLVSGSIELSIRDIDSKNILSPSQRATYSLNDQTLKIAEVNTDRDLDWLHNRLVFRDTPMKEVLSQLSRFYNVQFDVKDASIESYSFTGIFENRPLYQVLDYVKISSNVDYTILYSNKDKKSITIELDDKK